MNYRKRKQLRRAKNKVHASSQASSSSLKCSQEEFDLFIQHISLFYKYT